MIFTENGRWSKAPILRDSSLAGDLGVVVKVR